MGNRNEIHSCGQAAFRAVKKHFFSLYMQTVLQTLLRLPAFFCLYAALNGVSVTEESSAVWYALFCVSFLLLVIPFRFYYGEKLRFYSAPNMPAPRRGRPYFTWLRCGIIRFARGLLWGLPFLAGMGFFLYAMEYMPFKELGQFFQRIASFFFSGAEESGLVARGIILYFGGVFLMLLLFAWGWRRDLSMEYLPVRRIGVTGMLFSNRKARYRAFGLLRGITAKNALLSLPAFLICLLILIPFAKENIRVSGNPLMTVRSVKNLFSEPLSGKPLLLLCGDYFLVYLPLLMLRKMRNAVLIRRLTQELDGRRQHHAAG